MSTNYGNTGAGNFDMAPGAGCVGWAFTAMPESATLASISVKRGSTAGGTQPRVALYKGGTTSDPTGATLVRDFGQLTGSTADAVETLTAGSEALNSGDVLWLLFKTSSATSIKVSSTNGQGNFVNQQGAGFLNGQINGTVTNAFPSTVPGFNILDQGDQCPCAYITYDTSGPTGDLAATESGSDIFAATGGLANPGIRLTLRDTDTGALFASETGLIVSVRATARGSEVAGSDSESTDGSGVLELANAAIGVGTSYRVFVEDPGGNVAGYLIQGVDLNA